MNAIVPTTIVLIATSAAGADFSGPYAPANWTANNNGGNGTAVNDGMTLVLTGHDGAMVPGGIATDYTITAAAAGTWSFHWSFTSIDTGTFDSGGYLLNSAYTVLAFTLGGSGDVTLPVDAGDVIGYRVFSADGAIGPGVLTITNFFAPVPAPGAAGILLIAALRPRRRRRC